MLSVQVGECQPYAEDEVTIWVRRDRQFVCVHRCCDALGMGIAGS